MTVDQVLPPPGEFRTTEEIRDAKLAERLARRRRALLLWSLPVVLLALLAAVKLLSAVALNMAGSSAYAHQNHNTAAERFSSLEFFNVVEPWKAHFNQGTAIYAGGDFFAATTELDIALQLVPTSPEGEPPGKEECDVRTNYSLALEGLGDEALVVDDPAMAGDYYAQAQAMLSNCGESGGNGGEEAQDAEERQQESEAEAQEQQEQQESGEGGEEPTDAPTDGETPSGEPSESGTEDSPSGEPSETGTDGQPSGDPTESGSGGESADPRQEELDERNREAQESREAQEQESGGGNGSGQNW